MSHDLERDTPKAENLFLPKSNDPLGTTTRLQAFHEMERAHLPRLQGPTTIESILLYPQQ